MCTEWTIGSQQIEDIEDMEDTEQHLSLGEFMQHSSNATSLM